MNVFLLLVSGPPRIIHSFFPGPKNSSKKTRARNPGDKCYINLNGFSG